jgi:hypothetical protein
MFAACRAQNPEEESVEVEDVAVYTSSGNGSDSCSWACVQGGYRRESWSGGKYTCNKASRGQYSPPIDNDIYAWCGDPTPDPEGQG